MALRRSLIILIAILLPATALAAKKYVVKKGDNHYDLSRKFGITVDELKSVNHLDDNKLNIGEVLTIDVPVNDGDTAEKSIASGNNNDYIVKNGDTLGEIAERYGVTTKSLAKANGLSNTKLQIGQKLLIPSSNRGPVEAAATHEPAERDTAGKTTTKEESASKEATGAPASYTVEKGDTLGHIAIKFGVPGADIRKANGLKNNNLRIGQVLTIPGGRNAEVGTSVAASVQPDEAPARVKSGTYTVVKGDTPGEIAEKLGVNTDELIKLNDLDSRKLRIGQVLVIPGTQAADRTASIDNGTKENVTAEATGRENSRNVTTEYTVKKGDTLYDLSRTYGVSVDRIKKYNNLKGNSLKIGQRLVFDASAVSSASVKADRAEQATETESVTEITETAKYTGEYTVRRGDTLGHLAIKFGISQSDLKKANDLKGTNLRVGQVLLVPDGAVVTETEEVTIKQAPAEIVSDVYIKKRYVVKPGDTLGSIAANFGVTVDEIKKSSALKTDTINNGDIVLIPVPQEKVTQSKYTVAKGDTLSKIGKKFGVSVTQIKRANGLKSNTLRAGMRLNIPGLSSAEPVEVVAESEPASSLPRGEYVVRKGDTLGRIARRYDVTIKELKRENNLKSNSVRAGQVLYIPGYTSHNTEYRAAAETVTVHESNGQYRSPESQVENGRFSKESIIEVAKKYLGAPYKFGGNDLATGIDCSGYVKKIFSRFNVYLPRTARDIYYNAGYSVSKKNLDTGDLVFFTTYAKYPSHVGIYIGNDEFIHASSASRKVTIDSINKQYYKKRYIGAKRVQLSGLFYDELSKDYAGFEN
ncbi:MAG TPA: LysM peptidoglycan-binding domain-containing protein [Thermodesulfobacteriota bacterium]|nr:LysM peptidoglycan-binding domain-containing protein [Thermodesulfobacteriota bacterium]